MKLGEIARFVSVLGKTRVTQTASKIECKVNGKAYVTKTSENTLNLKAQS